MRQGSILTYINAKRPLEKVEKPDSSSSEHGDLKLKETNLPDSTEDTADSITKFCDLNSTVSDFGQKRDPKISIGPVNDGNLQILRAMTCSLLPVRYSDKFFKECVTDPRNEGLSAVVSYAGKVVGWIRCRIEPFPNGMNRTSDQIYVQVLAVLAPYRRLGMATELLSNVLQQAAEREIKASSIYAHVWERNEDGLEWYGKRGFRQVILQPAYYTRLKPSGAWLVRRQV